MTHEFKTLPHVPLSLRTTFALTSDPPQLLDPDSPAIEVMTSFRNVNPVTADANMSIDDVQEKMKAAGVRLLFVVDDSRCIVGLITATDIMGEKPIKMAQELRIPHSDIHVGMIMTPQSEVGVLTMASVENAHIGHIVATLKAMERRHALVVQTDEASDEQSVIGMFSASQIGKSIGRDMREDVVSAHSLAELVRAIG